MEMEEGKQFLDASCYGGPRGDINMARRFLARVLAQRTGDNYRYDSTADSICLDEVINDYDACRLYIEHVPNGWDHIMHAAQIEVNANA
jgi:hypothetical protein